MGTGKERQVLLLGAPGLAGKSEPKTQNKGTPGVWEDPGVRPRLPERTEFSRIAGRYGKRRHSRQREHHMQKFRDEYVDSCMLPQVAGSPAIRGGEWVGG